MVGDWKFTEPENLATLTVDSILSGERPVLYVTHDVSDGGWQFLTGDEVDWSTVKVVSLSEAVAVDPTLQQLADLPLGWCAERATPDAPWQRASAFPSDWDELALQAEDYIEDCQGRLESEFSLSGYERYSYNQESASLLFSTGGVERLRLKIQLIGSWASTPRTWLWSWNNPSVLSTAAESVHLLQTFGEQHGFSRLSGASWPAEEKDAWQIAAVACFLLGGDGVYRAPDENGALFMVLREPEFISS